MEYYFKRKMQKYQIEEFQRRIPFLLEDKFSYSINYSDELAYSITITCIEEGKKDELFYMMDRLVDDIYKLKNIPSKIFWEREYLESKSDLHEILNSRYVYKNSIGQITLSGELLELFNCFNKVFEMISKKIFSCVEYGFPVLLPTETLKRTGYFEHNPYQWMKVNRMRKGIKNYDIYSQKECQNQYSTEMCDSGYSLPPTMCYYVYDMIKNSSVCNSSYTTCGRSFRYEGDCDRPFERLVDFTIRETVFVGTRKFVENSVEKYMCYTTKLMDLLGICGKCETANDIFFMTDCTAERLNIQKMLGSKYELLLYIPDGKMLAVASFNKHGNFIGKKFNISINESTDSIAFSSCVGVGLERLVYSCVSQIGLEGIKRLNKKLTNTAEIIENLEKIIKTK